MSVMVTVEIPVQAGKMGAFLEFVVQALPATRAFDGCLKVEAFVEDGERSLVLVEM
jgi:quinol monooxygenase YgiN